MPLGAQHVTQDLAFGLSTGRAQAERLKTLYGSVLLRRRRCPPASRGARTGRPDAAAAADRVAARLTEIIRPRVEEILQLARRAHRPRSAAVTGRRLVLTGGGSQLEGIVELAEETFGMPARLGRARPFDAGAVQDLTAATTAIGLLRWASEDDGGVDLRRQHAESRFHGASGQDRAMAARELLSTEPKRPAQEEVPWLGDTTEEDGLNDHNLSMPVNHELRPRISVVGVVGRNQCREQHDHGASRGRGIPRLQYRCAVARAVADRAPHPAGHLDHPGAGGGRVRRSAAPLPRRRSTNCSISCSPATWCSSPPGWAAGTGAAPVIARAVREQGILTVGVVTKPFHFEGAHRMRVAEGGLAELQQYVDTLIVIPNQNLFRSPTSAPPSPRPSSWPTTCCTWACAVSPT